MKALYKLLGLCFIASPGLLFTPAVFAHTFGAQGAGLAAGFAHPFMGLDHLLAMIAVGMWAVQLGGRLLWLTPLTFVGVMTGGAVLGLQGIELPLLETAIAVSVLVLGLFVAFSARLPALLSVGLVGLFALFHGYAHGLELPQTASALLYGAGFVLATVLLHGIGLGLALTNRRYTLLARIGGSLIACTGFLLLAAA